MSSTATPVSPAPANPRNDVLKQLRAAFPVFQDFKPLAIGIHKTVRERLPEIAAPHLRAAMRAHVTSTRYLKAMSNAKERFDLDGNAAGEVTEEQRVQATTELRARFKKSADQRKAVVEAERTQAKLQELVNKFGSR